MSMSTASHRDEDEPLWLSVSAAAKITGLSKYVMGNLVKDGELVGRKIGARWYVNAEALREFNSVKA